MPSMYRPTLRPACALTPRHATLPVLLAATLLASTVVHAQGLRAPDTEAAAGRPTWELVISPYTLHWSQDPGHRRVGLVGLERHDADAPDSLWGLALFANSFGQPSAYAYWGHEWNGVGGHAPLYFKLSAGVIYGYKGAYEDKVPFNYKGFSPAVIPALGWRLTPDDSVQAAVLGTAGLMFSYNRRF